MKVTFPLHTIIDSFCGFIEFADVFKQLSSAFPTCFDETDFLFTDPDLQSFRFLTIRI